MDRYAVFGNPIAHSRSPFIHNFFAEETGEDISYEKILAPLDGFPDAVRKFFSEGGRGCNVTVPFKEEAFAMCESLSPRAEAAGAVNTLIFRDGVISGDNTDGAGFIADLKSQGVRIEGARVLLIGAGGASRGILFPLEAERPASLFIANRTVSKAEALAATCSWVPASAGTPLPFLRRATALAHFPLPLPLSLPTPGPGRLPPPPPPPPPLPPGGRARGDCGFWKGRPGQR